MLVFKIRLLRLSPYPILLTLASGLSSAGLAADHSRTVGPKSLHVIDSVLEDQSIPTPKPDPNHFVSEFYREVSYGRLNFLVTEYLGHLSLSEISSCPAPPVRNLPPEALNADYIAYVIRSGCDYFMCQGAQGGSSSVCSNGVSIHEIGHNLGFSHALGYVCRDANNRPVTIGDKCEVLGSFGDKDDVMNTHSGQGQGLSAPRRFHAGWILPSELADAAGGGTFTLEPFEKATSATKALRIVNGSSMGSLWIEYREKLGGAQIRVAGTEGHGETYLLYSWRGGGRDSLWKPGDKFEDKKKGSKGLEIAFLSMTAQSIVVQVKFPGTPTNPPPPAPADTVAPTIAILSPRTGAAVSKTARVLAEISDNVGVTKVEFYDGDRLIGTVSP